MLIARCCGHIRSSRIREMISHPATMLGLSDRWAFEAIRQVGNYGEIFARTLTPLGIDRGLNRLWNQGGLIYAPAMR